MEKSLWCCLLLTFLLADFRGPVSPQEDVIRRAYSNLLYPGQNLLFSPLPPAPPTLCGAETNIALVTLVIMGTLATLLTLLQDKCKPKDPSPVSALDQLQERASDMLPAQQPQTHTSSCEGQNKNQRLSLLLTLIPLGVVGMLLIMAGDVEQNPGPGPPKTHGQL